MATDNRAVRRALKVNASTRSRHHLKLSKINWVRHSLCNSLSIWIETHPCSMTTLTRLGQESHLLDASTMAECLLRWSNISNFTEQMGGGVCSTAQGSGMLTLPSYTGWHRCGGGELNWVIISHVHHKQLYAIVGNLNAAHHEILCLIVLPFLRWNSTIFQPHNARPHAARMSRQFQNEENASIFKGFVLDVLDQAARRRHPLSANNEQLHLAHQEEWEDIPQATIDNLMMFMRRRCAAVRQAHGGHILADCTLFIRI